LALSVLKEDERSAMKYFCFEAEAKKKKKQKKKKKKKKLKQLLIKLRKRIFQKQINWV
jgi:hypothetical protein